jgi:hypothetical protein
LLDTNNENGEIKFEELAGKLLGDFGIDLEDKNTPLGKILTSHLFSGDGDDSIENTMLGPLIMLYCHTH